MRWRQFCFRQVSLGVQAANTVLSRVAGEEPARVSLAFVGQCVSLGRKRAVFQLSHTDDTPRRTYIAGRLAAVMKEQICRGTVSFTAREGRKPGSYIWLRSGKRPTHESVTVS